MTRGDDVLLAWNEIPRSSFSGVYAARLAADTVSLRSDPVRVSQSRPVASTVSGRPAWRRARSSVARGARSCARSKRKSAPPSCCESSHR